MHLVWLKEINQSHFVLGTGEHIHTQVKGHLQYVWQKQPSPSKAFNTPERRASLLDYSQQAAANTADGHPQGLHKWEKTCS